MLQKVDKDRLDKVLKVIQDKGMKFPVATIEKDLNINKGNVSAYLKGKKSMSDNFYNSFMQQYESGEIKKPDVVTPDNTPLNHLIEGNKNLSQANKDLAAANLRLTAMLEVNSNSSHQAEHAQACLERIAEQGAGVQLHWKTKADGLRVLSNFLTETALKKVKVNN